MWNSPRLRGLAIEKLSALEVEAALKLELGLRYDVKQWLMPTIEDLVRREEPMGTEDIKRIGIENVLKIAALRECLHYGVTRTNSNSKGWSVRERGQIFIFPEAPKRLVAFLLLPPKSQPIIIAHS